MQIFCLMQKNRWKRILSYAMFFFYICNTIFPCVITMNTECHLIIPRGEPQLYFALTLCFRIEGIDHSARGQLAVAESNSYMLHQKKVYCFIERTTYICFFKPCPNITAEPKKFVNLDIHRNIK